MCTHTQHTHTHTASGSSWSSSSESLLGSITCLVAKRTRVEPARPIDAIFGCEAPKPPRLRASGFGLPSASNGRPPRAADVIAARNAISGTRAAVACKSGEGGRSLRLRDELFFSVSASGTRTTLPEPRLSLPCCCCCCSLSLSLSLEIDPEGEAGAVTPVSCSSVSTAPALCRPAPAVTSVLDDDDS